VLAVAWETPAYMCNHFLEPPSVLWSFLSDDD
jgi:hypothetical protein